MSAGPVPHELFTYITTQGIAAISEGRTIRDSPPRAGGRWGVSVVFRPTGRVGAHLDALTTAAIAVLGPNHWPTGRRGSAHLTIRALERYTDEPPNDSRLNEYLVPLRRAVQGLTPVRFQLTGLAVSPGTLMACADDVDGTASELRSRLHIELGERGWLENSHFANGRDPIWYATLVHFTEPVGDPAWFVDWFSANRNRRIGETTIGQIDLCRWRFDSTQLALEVLSSVGLANRMGLGAR